MGVAIAVRNAGAVAFMASAVWLVFVEALFLLTLATVSSRYFKLIINIFYSFYVFVLRLYGQLLLFFVKIASFARASELDHGEGFFAGNGTGDVEAGFVSPGEQLRRY